MYLILTLLFLGRRDDPVRIRRRIDDERLAAFLIAHQIGENRHLTDLPLLDEHDSSALFGAPAVFRLCRPPDYCHFCTKLTGCTYHFFASQVNGIRHGPRGDGPLELADRNRRGMDGLPRFRFPVVPILTGTSLSFRRRG